MLFPIFHGFIAPDVANARPMHAFRAAVGLAQQLDGQLSVAVGRHKIGTPNLLASATVEGLIAAEHRRSRESAAAALERVQELARGASVSVACETVEGDFSRLRKLFAARARIHGLIFAESGSAGELLDEAVLEALIFESGRPVVVVPNGYASPISCDHVLIAWDGSTGAARAVWDALPLLRLARTIEIATVTGEKDFGDAPPADALAPMLGFLGKDIRVVALPLAGGTAAGAIKEHAAGIGAGLIVQGAYGRSRWSEFILGGVTREMLRDSVIPVVMSH